MKELNTLFIEVVDNGFIVRENVGMNIHEVVASFSDIKVFNTKKSLCNYISKNTKINNNK